MNNVEVDLKVITNSRKIYRANMVRNNDTEAVTGTDFSKSVEKKHDIIRIIVSLDQYVRFRKL